MTRWGGRRAQRLTALCLATYGTVCWICKRDGATTADHLLPRSKGGSDDLANLRPAHHTCNSGRGNRMTSSRRRSIDASAFFKPE